MFADRTSLSGTSFIEGPVSMAGATLEPGEPPYHYSRTLWYAWTAPEDLFVTLSLAGSTGTRPYILVYVGDSLSALNRLEYVSNPLIANAEWHAAKGRTYVIALANGGADSNVVMAMTSVPLGTASPLLDPGVPTSMAPPNDNFSDAQAVTQAMLPRTLLSYGDFATREPAEPSDYRLTVWYTYTAETNHWLNLEMHGANPAGIAIYKGTSFSEIYHLDSLPDNYRNDLSVPIRAGDTYRIAVLATGGGIAGYRTRVNMTATPLPVNERLYGPESPVSLHPKNDNFADRQVLTGSRLTAIGFDPDATRESFEPSHGSRTLWYSWGTDEAGPVTIDFGTRRPESMGLAVYTGTDINTLTKVGGASGHRYTFTAAAGTVYHIATIGVSSPVGLADFDLAGPGDGTPPPIVVRSKLVNISTRLVVGNDQVAIPGFVITGPTQRTVLIRAVGPELARFTVTGFMSDPELTVYSGNTPIGSNDNWSSDATEATRLQQAFNATGAFSLASGSSDAAILLTLNPGTYTAHVRGVGGLGGDVLMEVYEVPETDE